MTKLTIRVQKKVLMQAQDFAPDTLSIYMSQFIVSCQMQLKSFQDLCEIVKPTTAKFHRSAHLCRRRLRYEFSRFMRLFLPPMLNIMWHH